VTRRAVRLGKGAIRGDRLPVDQIVRRLGVERNAGDAERSETGQFARIADDYLATFDIEIVRDRFRTRIRLYETRVAILYRKAEERGASFAEGVLEAVASLDIESVRELVGALNRLVAFQAVSEVPLDAAQARVLIGGLQPAETEALVVEQADTMDFAVAHSVDLTSLKPGTRVSFTLQRGGDGMYVIHSITPAGGQ